MMKFLLLPLLLLVSFSSQSFAQQKTPRAFTRAMDNFVIDFNRKSQEIKAQQDRVEFIKMFEKGIQQNRWHKDCVELFMNAELHQVLWQPITRPGTNRFSNRYLIGYYLEENLVLYFKVSTRRKNSFSRSAGLGRKCFIKPIN